MLSHPLETLPEPAHQPAPIETPEPTSPIRHEGAIVSDGTDESSFNTGSDFASAQYEEETADDELEGATLQASSIEEMDDLEEEETLEGAADLGTMLREMSIDQITRRTPVVEDEDDADDDLDEEDLDEDDLAEEELDEDDADASHPQNRQAEDDSTVIYEGGADFDENEQAARTGNAADAEFFAQQFGQTNEGTRPAGTSPSSGRDQGRTSGRDSDRRGGRRDGRRGRNDRDRDRGPRQ